MAEEVTVGAEVNVAYEWIASVCAASAEITGAGSTGAWADLAPASAQYPFIVFQQQAVEDLYGVGPNRIWVDGDYLIRAVAACDSYDPLKGLAAAIDSVFHNKSSVRSDGVVIGTRRRRQYAQVEEYEGTQIRHLGGIYQIIAQG